MMNDAAAPSCACAPFGVTAILLTGGFQTRLQPIGSQSYSFHRCVLTFRWLKSFRPSNYSLWVKEIRKRRAGRSMASAQTANSGVGISFDETSETLMAVFFGAVASFVVIFVAIMWRMTNEVLIARR